MNKEIYKGITREKIPWYPTVDFSKCIGCRKCVDYCKLGAYTFNDIKKQPIVSSPYNCVVLCEGCQDICPSGAISHPSRKNTIDLIRKLRRSQKKSTLEKF